MSAGWHRPRFGRRALRSIDEPARRLRRVVRLDHEGAADVHRLFRPGAARSQKQPDRRPPDPDRRSCRWRSRRATTHRSTNRTGSPRPDAPSPAVPELRAAGAARASAATPPLSPLAWWTTRCAAAERPGGHRADRCHDRSHPRRPDRPAARPIAGTGQRASDARAPRRFQSRRRASCLCPSPSSLANCVNRSNRVPRSAQQG